MISRFWFFFLGSAVFFPPANTWANSSGISETEEEIRTELEIRKSISDVESLIEKTKKIVKSKSSGLLKAQQKVPFPQYIWEDEDSSESARAVVLKYKELEMKSLLRQLESLDKRKGELQGDLELLQLRALDGSGQNSKALRVKNVALRDLNKPVCSQSFIEAVADRVIVSQKFGVHKDKETGLSWKNAGWWVSGVRDQVRACASGTVAYVGTITGRGRVLLIDHGNSNMTLYANMADDGSSTLTRGSRVMVGAPIGNVGEKLYFEIRRQGEAVDPKTALSPQVLSNFQF